MNEVENKDWVFWAVKLVLVLSLLMLASKSFSLAVIKKNLYQGLARDNKIYEMDIPAARGSVVDRKGRTVAESIYRYFRIDGESKVYEGEGEFDGYKFEGKNLAYDLKRKYDYGQSMSFVSGYIGRANETDVANKKCGVELGPESMVGRGGVEEFFDCKLRGVDGKRLVEVDAKGKYIRELGRQEPIEGKTIQLSVDAYWQDKIYKLLDGRKAAVVISEPKTGKIISMVSSPAYDPNDFSFNRDDIAIKSVLNDSENLPLLNRAASGRYHPGSVFKLTVAAGGLETGVIDGQTLIEDTGIIKVGDYSYSNWLWTKRGGTDGMVDIVKALKRSNDIFFYKLGERMGPDNIHDWAYKFGYGAKTGVEIPGEVEGVVPDEAWKKEARGESWFLGNTYHYSIGQGDLGVTPLQVNMSTNVIASGGKKCKLSLIKDSKAECETVGLNSNTLSLIRSGMEAACSEGGTAWPLFGFKTNIACKTGTAEVGDGSQETHAWLTAYAPVENPEISITVMVERGGEGSDVAAPIVGDILRDWFSEPETKVPRYDENHKVVYE